MAQVSLSSGSLASTTAATAGFLPIRAPVTLDDDSSDFYSDGYKTDYSESNASVSGRSVDNGYVSGEEFETASDRPFIGDPDAENSEDRGFMSKYQLSRPVVAAPDEENLESVISGDEGSDITDEYVPTAVLDSPNLEPVRPIAQLSMDDDVDEVLGDASEVEDDGFSGVPKPPLYVEGVESMARVEVLGVEGGGGDELSAEIDSAIGNRPELLVARDDEVSVLGEGFGGLGSKDEILVKGSDNYSVAVKLLEGNDYFESLVGSKDSWDNPNFDDNVRLLDDENLKYENLEQKKLELDDWDGHQTNIIGYNLASHISEQFESPQSKELIAKVYVDTDDSYDGAGVEAVEVDQDGVIVGSDSHEKGSEINRLEGNDSSVTVVELESTALEIAGIDDINGMNAIQAMGSVGDGNLSENSERDGWKDAGWSNTKAVDSSDASSGDLQTRERSKYLLSDEDIKNIIFGVPGTTDHFMNGSEKILSSKSGSDVSHDQLEKTGAKISLDSDDSASLVALLKAVTTAESDGGRVFSVDHHTDSNSFHTMRSNPPMYKVEDVMKEQLSVEEKEMVEKMQHIRVKYLRLVKRLGYSPEYPMVTEILHRLILPGRGLLGQEFSLENAKRVAMQLEGGEKDNLDVSLNILVLGKTGVGKSATINSIFGEKKVMSSAFEPATTRVKEILGSIDGVRIRILDTPGLRSTVKEEATNLKILASVKKIMKKFPPDVVLYVDRLDTHAKDLNDLPLLSMLTKSLTTSIWKNAIITLTHAASPPPDGPSGSPLSFEVYVAQRSHVVQQAISYAVGDGRLLLPSMRHPVSLVENHPLCLKNENKEFVLPDGQSWRPQLLLLCYSLKILSEASDISKPQVPSGGKRLLGRLRALPLPHLVSSLLQSRRHPKLTADQGVDEIDQDAEMMDLSADNDDDEDDYEQLPPFMPLRKSQVDKLSKEQKKAYFEEYDYRVKLFQKKQLREQVKELKEMKKRSKDDISDPGYKEESGNQEDGDPGTVPLIMPDFVLPPTFDSENPSYRYRILEPTSGVLVRPVLESQGWDHDCGYDGVSIERNLAVVGRFPGALAIQITKDKKDFNIHLDSSICAKHGENGSTMAGFDVQTFGEQLAYILRSETEFKNFKMNKTSAGITVTVLGENIATGLKVEDHITVAKRVALVGSAGAVTSRGDDTAYGANFEVCLRSKDFPIEHDQSTLGLSLLRWRGDLGMMATLQSQLSIGRDSKVSIRVGMNNKRSGQISIKTSSSDLQIALVSLLPIAKSIFRSINSTW